MRHLESTEKFKEYPTDEDYDARYWRNFIKRQKAHRADLERLAREAVETNNLAWLQNQMVILGIHQAQLKQWLFSKLFPPGYQVDWGEKTPAWLRREIMNAEGSEIPKWQRREALYIINMYHDVLVEMELVLKQRRR